MNLIEAAEEMAQKNITMTDSANKELAVIGAAVNEVVNLAYTAFVDNDLKAAAEVEPLEEVVDDLKEALRTRHILRLQKGLCSIEVGFVWSDLLTGLERISDHCSNIAVCVIDMAHHDMNQHEALRKVHAVGSEFDQAYKAYAAKYPLSLDTFTN